MIEEPSLAELPPTSGELKEVWDSSTGLPVVPEMVAKARQKEKDSMSQLGVTNPSSLAQRREQTSYDPFPTQWLDLNKGDKGSPQIRSRLVATWLNRVFPLRLLPVLNAWFPPVCACFPPLLFGVTCRTLVPLQTETSQTFFQYNRAAPM